ncbi:hypothetical protein GGQ85_001054 [Nitrobacter vulgaris]|nr:hypothetical protein [Nitrobacter vulgaris]
MNKNKGDSVSPESASNLCFFLRKLWDFGGVRRIRFYCGGRDDLK